MNEIQSPPGAGGTPGGSGQFLLGGALALIGVYIFLSRVVVVSDIWTIYGINAFGVALLPFILGISMLFFKGKSIAGWLLAGGSFLFMLVGLVSHLTLFFLPTNLLTTLFMIAMIGAGLGLVARSLRPRSRKR